MPRKNLDQSAGLIQIAFGMHNKMAAKPPLSIDTRTDLAELVKRRAEIAVSIQFILD